MRAARALARRAATVRRGVALLCSPRSGACSTYKPAIPPSEGHISAQTVTPPGEQERILPPVTSTTTFTPPPKPRSKPTTYSVVVHEVPVKELLLALARDTKENIDIHPGLSGLVSLNAIDETLPSILERIAKQVNMRYRVDGRTIVVEPDTPYLKTYKVNYVNMTRDTTSSISVSGQVGSDAGRIQAAPRQRRSRPPSRPTSGKCCARTSTASSPPAASSDQSAAERQARAERVKAAARAAAGPGRGGGTRRPQRQQPLQRSVRSGKRSTTKIRRSSSTRSPAP